MSGRPWYAAPLWVAGAAWTVSVLGVGVLVLLHGRQVPSANAANAALPVATRDLAVGHVLAPGDLRSTDTTALLDHYLQKPVKAGDPVTAKMTSAAPVPRRHINTIAAVIAIPAAVRQLKGIDVGSFVGIYRGAAAFGPPGHVMAVDCDEAVCSVLVELPKIPGRIIDPDAVANASLEPVPPPSSLLEPVPDLSSAPASSPGSSHAAPAAFSPPPTPTRSPTSVDARLCVVVPVMPLAQLEAGCEHCSDPSTGRLPLGGRQGAGISSNRHRPAVAPKNVCSGR